MVTERKTIFQKLKKVLEGTTRENPRICEIFDIREDEYVGLSSLELPRIDKAFLENRTVWFHIYGSHSYEPFGNFKTKDLRKILTELTNKN